MLAYSQAGSRQWIEDCSSDCLVSYHFPGVLPSLSRVNAPALLPSLHSSTLEQGLPQPGREPDCGTQR